MPFKKEKLEQKAIVEKTLPKTFLGKFIITDVKPMTGKTVKDGLQLHLVCVSYLDKPDGVWVPTIAINKEGDQTVATFIEGKKGLLVKKLKSPKWDFKYLEDGQWKVVYKHAFSEEAFVEELKEEDPAFDNYTLAQIDEKYHEWLADAILWMMSKELRVPSIMPGTQVQLFRNYVPPKEGQKYGNVNITKYAPKESQFEGDSPDEFKTVPQDVFEAILALISEDTKENTDDPLPF